jgi:hypothetical protein
MHQGDHGEVRHARQHILVGAHGTYALSRRISCMRSRQDGLDATGTRDTLRHPQVFELHVHVYKTGHCIRYQRHERQVETSLFVLQTN